LLLISQVFLPDPASVGQHLAGAAESMVAKGWEVRVITSATGYEDPSLRFPQHEVRNGVDIHRLSFTSFGKGSIAQRLAGQLSFVIQSTVRSLRFPKADLVLISTSPPFAGAIALAIAALRGTPFAFWAMDINPDQAVASGAFAPSHPLVTLMERMNHRLLSRARRIIALDPYMAETLIAKVPAARSRVRIAPPWPHEDQLERIEHEENPFRAAHDLQGKFVVMFSGNHSPVHPLDTLLHAARALACEPFVFAFIGGGQGKRAVETFVEAHGLKNVLLLPYQPLDQIRYSLSAADVHVVSMGDPMVGIIHPCKFYGAMALGRPVLLLGPTKSHVGDVLQETRCGWQIGHGETDRLITLLRQLRHASRAELDAVGARGLDAVQTRFSERRLRDEFVGFLEECVDDPQLRMA
jgi:glycosyltransferase involved in cell wall biosynthesis